ncbi:MAG: hypothetical protein HYT71_01975 [Candidatus Aenigmarchaeota archaeon]|nr:hypothetical protein [Candidatus Aenigmarchaeota archaeon]
MTTISELAGALLGNEWDEAAGKSGRRNYTDLDREIARSVGVKLGNNTRDHRILKLLSDAREYAQVALRQNFEAALEKELECLQETGLTLEQFDTAMSYAKKLVRDRMRQGVGTVEVKGIVTPYNLFSWPRNVKREDGHMEIDIGIYGLVGYKRFDPQKKGYNTVAGSSDDAKKIARTFQSITAVDLEPSLGLQARRLGRPSVTELHQPAKLPDGTNFFHAYEVEIAYRTRIPIGMMHTLYEQSQKTPAN